MANHSDEFLFDARLVERHIQRGLLTRQQVDARLQALEDMSEQADFISLEALTGEQHAGNSRSDGNSQTPLNTDA